MISFYTIYNLEDIVSQKSFNIYFVPETHNIYLYNIYFRNN